MFNLTNYTAHVAHIRGVFKEAQSALAPLITVFIFIFHKKKYSNHSDFGKEWKIFDIGILWKIRNINNVEDLFFFAYSVIF